MATQTFHAKLAAQAGTAANELIQKAQLDSGVAAAQNLANATGQLSDTTYVAGFNTAVDGRVQLIVDAAPAALDTLNELAAALGDDPNFSATVTTSLGALDTRIDALEAATGAGTYKTTIGDAVVSSFVVTHGLGTTDVTVEVVRLTDGQTVYPVVTRPSANTVGVDYGTDVPASASQRVLIRSV